MNLGKLGTLGEDRAAAYLKLRGWKIVDRNYSCRFGELDIIAQRGNILAFVEVKLRSEDSLYSGREAVTAAKQKRIISTAELWLSQNETELQPRFDVIELARDRSGRVRIVHIEDAFQVE